MAPREAILHFTRASRSVAVSTMLDDHHAIVMPPALVPAEIAMFAELGTGAEMAMAAFLDHDGLGAGYRRRRDGDGGKCGNDVSKLLHAVLLGVVGGLNGAVTRTFPGNPKRILNSRSASLAHVNDRALVP